MRKKKYPRLQEVTRSRKCSLCNERSVVTAVIQVSDYRKYHDKRLYLCAGHNSNSSGGELDKHDLLDVWISLQEVSSDN